MEERFEVVTNIRFDYLSLYIRKPCFATIQNYKGIETINLYPKLKNFKKKLNSNKEGQMRFIEINNEFKATNLRWIRHIKQFIDPRVISILFTKGNYKQRHINYRLWGEFEGQIFDITSYFNYYYKKFIPIGIPLDCIKEKGYFKSLKN